MNIGTSNLASDRPPAPSTHIPTQPAGAASNQLGAHHRQLPQFENVEEKAAAAKAQLEEVTARQNAAQQTVSDARQRSADARQRCSTERETLATAQKELAAALLANTGNTEKVQRRIQDLQTRIDALTSLSDSALKEAERAAVDATKFRDQVAQADKDLKEAELNALLAQYATLLKPLIPLAREISWRAPHLTVEPSYLIDVRRPHLGNLSVRDDGSIFFYLR